MLTEVWGGDTGGYGRMFVANPMVLSKAKDKRKQTKFSNIRRNI